MSPASRTHRLARALSAVALAAALPAAVLTGPARAAGSGEPTVWARTCSAQSLGLDDDQLLLAPSPNPGNTNPDGSLVTASPDLRGRYTPVIMVHGWASDPGTFTHLIDLTANRIVSVDSTRSLIGQLQRITGAAVFSFDYSKHAGAWVDDPHLGPALGKVIDCLYRASGQKVIVVGHSMGGLLTRYAASHPGAVGTNRAGEISTVVTFGTPETGSVIARDFAQGLAVAGGLPVVSVFRLLMAACGQLGSHEAETGSLCDQVFFLEPARLFDSNAGIALRAGSPQLAALAPFPPGITIDALAGDMAFVIPQGGWFGISWDSDVVDVGDFIVTTDSALHIGKPTKSAGCGYQLNLLRGVADEIGVTLKIASKAETARQPLAAFHSPCFHSSLMRDIELTNEATGAVLDDILARQMTPEQTAEAFYTALQANDTATIDRLKAPGYYGAGLWNPSTIGQFRCGPMKPADVPAQYRSLPLQLCVTGLQQNGAPVGMFVEVFLQRTERGWQVGSYSLTDAS